MRAVVSEKGVLRSLVLLLALGGAGCMALSPQLPPTDFAALERVADRQERENLYADNAIVTHDEPQGKRYTKGSSPHANKHSWQSLDVILRSDASASAALPKRSLRLARLFTALTIACGILTVAGIAASAREGLNLKELNGTGGVLLGGGLATVGFGITAGVFYGRAKTGYQNAVAIYNDSLAVRLGINTPQGDYIPGRGQLVDEEGNIMLEEPERAVIEEAEREEAEREAAEREAAEREGADEAITPAPAGPRQVEPRPAPAPEVAPAPAPTPVPPPPAGEAGVPAPPKGVAQAPSGRALALLPAR